MSCKKLFFALLCVSSLVDGQSLKHLLNSGNYPRVCKSVLDLSNYNLSDINGIEDYPDIEYVDNLIIKDNKIKSLKPLAKLYEKYKNPLQWLDICSNKICDITPLYNFKKTLKHLYAEYNQLDSNELISILIYLNLESLYIEFNPINNAGFSQNQIMGRMRNKNYLDIINYSRKYQIHKIDVFKVTSDEFSCGICLDENDQEDLYATQCLHVFHGLCLSKWLKTCYDNRRYKTCPNCRRSL